MSQGTYWNGKRYVSAEEFRRPNVPAKPPKKPHPNQLVRKDIKR